MLIYLPVNLPDGEFCSSCEYVQRHISNNFDFCRLFNNKLCYCIKFEDYKKCSQCLKICKEHKNRLYGYERKNFVSIN
jgi:hypothetical protein